MKKLIIHIGYPKTATSTIQDLYFMKLHKEGKINYLGKGHLLDSELYSPASEVVDSIINYEFPLSDRKLELMDNKINVLSNEDFPLSFHNIDGQSYLPKKNPLLTAERLKKYLETNHADYNVKIVCTIRNQTSLIHSVYTEGYTWYFRHEKSINTFEKYLKQGLQKKKDGVFLMYYYNDVIEEYAKLFHIDNITVLFFEDLKNDMECIANTFSKIFNQDSQYFINALSIDTNKKITTKVGYRTSGLTLKLFILDLRKKNLIFNFIANKFRNNEKAKDLFHKILKNVSGIKIKRGHEIAHLTEEESKKVQKLFNQENKKLERFDVSIKKLKKYGYTYEL
jgi:hypothetical protein